MVHTRRLKTGLAPAAVEDIRALGQNLRVARTRRGLTMAEMASRMFVSRQTLARLENGDPGVSVGALASALWVLGLQDQVRKIAAPERDEVGVFRERQRLPRRVRPSSRRDDLDF
ncbi:MAG: helix-turn-helix transcriptional regulator [Deferrisomatales bacterium]